MKNPMVILVHGVGGHTGESFKKQVQNALDTVSSHYANVPKFSEYFDVQTIAYNDVFKKVLENAREATADLSEYEVSILTKLNQYQEAIGEDNFFTENALDAFVYKTFLAGAVEAEVAEQFYKLYNETIKGGNVRDCHLICHSLGTAVMHNVLQRLYATRDIDGGIKYLSPSQNKLKSITMLANVSRLYPLPCSPYDSIIKPGPNGSVKAFLDARHKFDPIPLIRPFEPASQWPIPDLGGFKGVTFSDCVDLHALDENVIDDNAPKLNVHAVEHYLTAPMVHVPLFKILLPVGKRPTKAEAEDFQDTWEEHSLGDLIDQFKEAVGTSDILDGNFDDIDKLKSILEQMATFFK